MTSEDIDKVRKRMLEVGFTDEQIDRMSEEELGLYAKAILEESNGRQ